MNVNVEIVNQQVHEHNIHVKAAPLLSPAIIYQTKSYLSCSQSLQCNSFFKYNLSQQNCEIQNI